ncbi:MAG: hemerythrin domain-containing protein [Gammaproteobacteria bacterium]
MFNFHGTKHEKQRDRTGMCITGKDCAPGTELSFDPGLIKQLKKDHQAQMQLAAVILMSAREAKFDRTKAALSQFRRHLQAHLISEDLHLYAYLAYCLKGVAERMPVMTDVRSEMAAIGRRVMRFVQRYDEAGVEPGNAKEFLDGFGALFKLLAKRNEYEEVSLFPKYLHPSALKTSQMTPNSN